MFKVKSTSHHRGLHIAFSLIVMLGVSACDFLQMPSQKEVEKKTESESKKNLPRIDEAAGIGVKPKELDPLAVSDDFWLGNEAIRIHSGKALPEKFENSKGFTLISAAPIDLQTVAIQVSNATGIKTLVGDLTLPTASSGTSPLIPPAPVPASPDAAGTLPAVVKSTKDSINVSYSGPLSKFLDQVAAQMDVSWRYDGQDIYIYRYESKTFMIEALSAKSSISDSFSPSGSSGSSGSSSSSSSDVTQKNDLTSDSDAWKDIEAAIKGIIGSDGAEVMVPSSGTVVVTARPSKLDQIGKYLQEENKRMTRQVAIDIVAYSVSLTNGDNYGIDLSNVFSYRNNTSPTSAGVLASATGATTSIGTATFTANTAGANTSSLGGTLNIAYLSSHWSGQAIAQALSTVGHTVEITRAPIVTLNNRAASRKIATDQTYIASSSTTPSVTAGVAPTSTVTPGVATTGITLQVLPRLTTDDRILVQYSINISALNGAIGTSCSNDASSCIGTPNTSNKVFVQQALLQNGSTLVLAGFEDENDVDSSQGIGSAYNWLLGGTNASNTKQQLVITITPHEITPGRVDS